MNLKNYIEQINQQFVDEAIKSPQLMSDMAMMEKYMSESYNDRILIELIQNADDSSSTKIKLIVEDEYVFFCNNGHNFNEQDILSISRSGTSGKKRGESIGYRGVGFKSSTAISNEIIIYSADTYFTFSKSICSKKLNVDIDSVPIIRIPFLLDDDEVNSKVKSYIKKITKEGYSTIFIFKTTQQEKVISESKDIDKSDFLFLRNIVQFDIESNSLNRSLGVKRYDKGENSFVELIENVQDDKWLIHNTNNIQFAFKLMNDKIIPCTREESVFHCFLPTIDNNCYAFKINADFSTDPSRKHLFFDDTTSSLIEQSAKELVKILNSFVDSNSKIFELFINPVSFSKGAIIFQKEFDKQIKSDFKILLNNADYSKIDSYKIFDYWLESSEVLEIRNNCKYIYELSAKNNFIIDEFIKKYSNKKYEYKDYIKILKDKDFIGDSNIMLISKIYAHVIEMINEQKLNVEKELSECYFITDGGLLRICDINKYERIDSELISLISNLTAKTSRVELEKLFNESLYDISNESDSQIISKKITSINNSTVSKWKTAEEQCVSVEELLGNTAIAVGNKNLGYDVESVTSSGEKRYIEVKSLDGDKSSFSLTNNEYSSAHMNKYNYYLCLIKQTNDSIKVIYIQNPIDNIELEKRVKQWEWYCEKYTGEEYTIKLEN